MPTPFQAVLAQRADGQYPLYECIYDLRRNAKGSLKRPLPEKKRFQAAYGIGAA